MQSEFYHPQSLARRISDEEWTTAQTLRLEDENLLSPSQIKEIRRWATEALRSQSRAWRRHNSVNFFILMSLLGADFFIVWQLPAFLQAAMKPSFWSFLLGVLISGLCHGFLAYSLVNYSLHEGAAHRSIILEKGPLTRILAWIANNACRLFFADPLFYRANHQLHHQKFATRDDGAFSNFVSSRRILLSLLPYASLFNLSDYKIQSSMFWNPSRLVSGAISLGYSAVLFSMGARAYGFLAAFLIVIIIGPWIGFGLDRLRESSEHMLMPLNHYSGVRNLGFNAWGLFIGGGPWGQPCHLSHHLGPHLGWYQQIRLHQKLKSILSLEQQKIFFVAGGCWGFPIFFLRQLKKIRSLEKQRMHKQGL